MGWARRAIISFSYAPLDMMVWLAVITTTLAVVAAVTEIVLRITDPSAAPKGYATLIVVVLFIGGVQMFCFSVVGSYLAHMYEEIKSRPAYIVSQVLNPPRSRQPVEEQSEELIHADVRVVATVDDGEP
jgi:dolichol-phosphate mannosyltransferase